jgi:hypothetical protein
MTTVPSPRIDASQPTTNRAGAERPSIVKVDAPGRVDGGGDPAGGVSGGGVGGGVRGSAA